MDVLSPLFPTRRNGPETRDICIRAVLRSPRPLLLLHCHTDHRLSEPWIDCFIRTIRSLIYLFVLTFNEPSSSPRHLLSLARPLLDNSQSHRDRHNLIRPSRSGSGGSVLSFTHPQCHPPNILISLLLLRSSLAVSGVR